MDTSAGADWLTWPRAAVRRELANTPVVVLYGGTSSERAVSLVSGRAILAALEEHPADAPDVPASVVGVEIDAGGDWHVDGEPRRPHEALARLPSDAVFLLGLHGGEGEDGTLQGFLDLAGRRYTGSGVAASALCMDKHRSRLAFQAAGLVVAPGRFVPRGADRRPAVRALERLGGPPWYVKPNRGGSSVGTYRSEDAASLAEALGRVHALGSDALVEVGVAGVELTCGVIGNDARTSAVLPLVEIRPKPGRFFDYEEKYEAGGAIELCPPESVDTETAALVQERARTAYAAAGCTGYARVDFILPAGTHEPVVLEINTLPGFTPTSLLPKEAAVAGVSFRSLCLELVALALEPG